MGYVDHAGARVGTASYRVSERNGQLVHPTGDGDPGDQKKQLKSRGCSCLVECHKIRGWGSCMQLALALMLMPERLLVRTQDQ